MNHGNFTQQDHYTVLGVDRKASHDAIREAYLKLVKKHHPDVSNGPESAENFKAIASAWEVGFESPQSFRQAHAFFCGREHQATDTPECRKPACFSLLHAVKHVDTAAPHVTTFCLKPVSSCAV